MATKDYSTVPAVVTLTNTLPVVEGSSKENVVGFQFFRTPHFTVNIPAEDVVKIQVQSSAELAYYDTMNIAGLKVEFAAVK